MRRYQLMSLLFLGFAVSGCSSEADLPDTGITEEENPQSAAIEMCQDELAGRLKDPRSAQFQNVQAYDGIAWKVTGEMNAKNSMGGYVGFAPFRCDLLKSATTGEIDSIIANWEGK